MFSCLHDMKSDSKTYWVVYMTWIQIYLNWTPRQLLILFQIQVPLILSKMNRNPTSNRNKNKQQQYKFYSRIKSQRVLVLFYFIYNVCVMESLFCTSMIVVRFLSDWFSLFSSTCQFPFLYYDFFFSSRLRHIGHVFIVLSLLIFIISFLFILFQ